ncbi:MAG: hypothetical protein WAK57_00350, partial [Desulfobacterales bacterium]
GQRPRSGATKGTARATTAMARIAALVDTLWVPPGKAPPPGTADPVLRVPGPSKASAAPIAAATAAGAPPPRPAPTGTAPIAPPEGLAGVQWRPEVTEPEDLAELINDVLVDQARRHGVNLS